MSILHWLIDHCLVPPLAALQFLTLMPPIVRRAFRPRELGRAVGYFPLVGVLLGALLTGLDRGLTRIFSPSISAALVLTTWVIATGALHIDGFLDTLDGLFGGHTSDMRMEIMRDEQVGAFGLSGGVLLMLLKMTALTAVREPVSALLLTPTLARWGMTLAVVAFPYARPKGLGRALKDHAGWRQAALATSIALATAWFGRDCLGLPAMALSGALTWAMARFVLTRLSGLTGDVYGAIGETVELVLLLFFATALDR